MKRIGLTASNQMIGEWKIAWTNNGSQKLNTGGRPPSKRLTMTRCVMEMNDMGEWEVLTTFEKHAEKAMHLLCKTHNTLLSLALFNPTRFTSGRDDFIRGSRAKTD